MDSIYYYFSLQMINAKHTKNLNLKMNSLKRIVNSNSRVFNATRRTKQWRRFYSTPVEFGRLMYSQNTKRLSIVGVDGSYKLSNERILSPLLKSVEEETRRLALPNGVCFQK